MAHRKEGAFRIKPKSVTVALAVLYGFIPAAHAAGLPDGGHFVAGSGSIGQAGNSLTINQDSTRGVIDWKGFSIGAGNSVTFNNGAGATLNRVTGGDPSAIFGTLSATGSVYLINPQGIVIGPSGVVSTGGRFVASTLDTCDGGFMKGDPLTFTGTSSAQVVNLGTVGSTGGDVMLIAGDGIVNAGHIAAPNGTAELAIGRSVLLQDSSTGRQVFVQTGNGGTIENDGPISAAQVSLQAADGNIFALAGDHTTIRATGVGERDGHVWLVADSRMVALGGTIEAQNADGSGGIVDTKSARFELGSPGITPLILAAQWSLTTPDFTVGSAEALALARSLNAGTSIDLETTGGGGRTGDINVASDLHWHGDASFTLGAYRSININPGVAIRNKGSGNLSLRADSTAIDNGGSVANNGTIDWSNSTGIVSAYYDKNGSYSPGAFVNNAAWTSPQYSGLVTQMTGYELVNSIADWNALTNFSGNYALGRNISAAGSYVAQPSAPFVGQFDGLGHAIDDPYLVQVAGLFLRIGTGGVVRNLGITNASTLGCYGCNAGLFAAENDGLLANVYATGTVTYFPPGVPPFNAGSSYFGGLVGLNTGTIARSWSSAKITGAIDLAYHDYGSGALGGLVGVNVGTIAQSYATGNISGGTNADIGALVGFNSGAVTQSFATGFSKGGVAGGFGIIGSGGGGTTDDYWNVQTTGVNKGGGSVPSRNGLTTTQMSDPQYFYGWDFSSAGVWAMPSGATHPVLRWQLQQPSNAGGSAS